MQNYIKSYKDLFELASARGDADPIPETPIPEEQEDAPPVDPQAAGLQAGSSNDPPAEQQNQPEEETQGSGEAESSEAPSRDQGARRRRIDVNKLRAQAKNTLHFVLELLCSRYLFCIVRMMLMVYTVLQEEHSGMIVYALRGSNHVKNILSNWALGHWKKTIIAIYATAWNLEGLKKCRFDTSLGPFLTGTRYDEEEIAYQDMLAYELHLMILGQVTYRTIEGIIQSFNYPQCFAD
jgi:hypothetical protein